MRTAPSSAPVLRIWCFKMRPEFQFWPVAGQPVVTGCHRFSDPSTISTALRESAYQRRTRYICGDGRALADFTPRGADLEAVRRFVPANAPEWLRSPFLTWRRADQAAERCRPGSVRAWQVVADLPSGLTPGEGLDGASTVVESSFRGHEVVADMAIHVAGGQRHAHLLIASRHLRDARFGSLAADRRGLIDGKLRRAWHQWLKGKAC